MNYFTVGLTGGLASGKTTVLHMFQQLGIDILSADSAAHQLIRRGESAYFSIIEHFGENIMDSHREINRKILASLIFNFPEEKRWLENLLHPLIRQSLWQQRQTLRSAYAVIEIPLLAENQASYTWLDRILVVDCDEETQQYRAKQRSGLTYQESGSIMSQQASRQTRNNIAHDIIINHGDINRLELEVKALHNKYLRLSQ